ncbi:hypothetical protein ISS37_08010 [candidate division KSB1 bacterium]|nr:hypothetical protein [candidate division KSB1 bacterium]
MKRNDISLLKVEIESDLSDLDVIVQEIQVALKEIGTSIPTHRDKAAIGSFLHEY